MQLVKEECLGAVPAQRRPVLSGIEYLNQDRLDAIGEEVNLLTPEQRSKLAFVTVRQITELRDFALEMSDISFSKAFDRAVLVAQNRGRSGDAVFQGMTWGIEKQSPQTN